MTRTTDAIRHGTVLCLALALTLTLGREIPAAAASLIPVTRSAVLTSVPPVRPVTPSEPGNNPPQQNPEGNPAYNPGEAPIVPDPGVATPPDTFTPSVPEDPGIYGPDLMPAIEQGIQDLLELLLISDTSDSSEYIGGGGGSDCASIVTAAVGGGYGSTARFGNHGQQGVTPLMMYNGGC